MIVPMLASGSSATARRSAATPASVERAAGTIRRSIREPHRKGDRANQESASSMSFLRQNIFGQMVSALARD
jgi:hypothetical protein